VAGIKTLNKKTALICSTSCLMPDVVDALYCIYTVAWTRKRTVQF